MAEIRSEEPLEGEYTDSELPADAVLPKDDADVNDGDWSGDEDAVIVERTDTVIVEDEGEYTDTDFDADRRRDGI
ncbi:MULTISPECIES: hypothetical protein [unclassified Agromyces]|uniref:hypothetical protein n=1 Tax=unclassified Agromyces TaxID=2639701 RepID=UPI003014E926